MYLDDDWPKMSDGNDFDGTQLLSLVRSGHSPFRDNWDVGLLIQEIEESLGTQVIDIPYVSQGSNNYGFHVTLSNRPDTIARLGRSDVNTPGYKGLSIEMQTLDAEFEVAVYELLRSEPSIRASHILYSRVPVQRDGPRLGHPKDLIGRRLFIFEKTEGENNIWDISSGDQTHLLTHLAQIRASLFDFKLPLQFAAAWLRDCLFEPKPELLPTPVAPTREFCIALLTAKVEATIRDLGDMIGWESDNNTVGPRALAARQSILRLIPHMIPQDDSDCNQHSPFFRLVLEHGDYGIHNVSIATQTGSSRPFVTSLYDWETACVVPAILSDPLVAVAVNLVTDDNAIPSVTRMPKDEDPEQRTQYMTWSEQYFKELFDRSPTYRDTIRAGKDARHLWFALRNWRGDDPENYFGALGEWAEKRLGEFTL